MNLEYEFHFLKCYKLIHDIYIYIFFYAPVSLWKNCNKLVLNMHISHLC